ncbi:MAG: LptF/LptG family permease [Deltaproteobacteria bacterium]|nr:LptF/LptG family permease [Deltaproteobacteria bacterium]
MVKVYRIFKIFHVYVLRELSYIFSLALFLLTFTLVLGRIRKLTDLIINKGVEIQDIFLLLLYSSPPSLTFTLPMAFLLSAIVVLGRLSSENEILTLKTSGINLKNIFVPVFFFGLAITVLGLINTFFFLPKSGDLFRDTLMNIVRKGITIEDREGVFNDSIPGIVIYIEKVQIEQGYLSGILVSDEREQNVKQVVTAKKGLINFDASNMNLTFILNDGVLHRWEKDRDTYRNLSFKDYNFTISLATLLPKAKPVRKRPYEMGINELKQLIDKEQNESKRYELLLEMYKKLSLPLSSLFFVLLTVPLGIRRRSEGKFTGITYSLFIFILYYLLMALTDYMGATLKFSPLFTAFLPNIVVGSIGVYLTKGLNHEEYESFYKRIKLLYALCHEKIR